MGPKTIPETRSGRALANPMIYLNITSVLRRVDPEQEALYNERARSVWMRSSSTTTSPSWAAPWRAWTWTAPPAWM